MIKIRAAAVCPDTFFYKSTPAKKHCLKCKVCARFQCRKCCIHKSAPVLDAIKRAVIFLTTAWQWASSCCLERCQWYTSLTSTSSRCSFSKVWNEWGENESERLGRSSRNQHTPSVLLMVSERRYMWRTQECSHYPLNGTAFMAHWKYIIRENSRLQATAGNSAWVDLWAVGSRNPVRSLLKVQSCVRRSFLPSPCFSAWALWAGARMFWCLILIYFFDRKEWKGWSSRVLGDSINSVNWAYW